MTWAPAAVTFVIDVLNQLDSPYLLTGSVASNAYTEPRGTIDADFVVAIKGDELTILRQRMGSEFIEEEQLAFETVTGKTVHKFRHRPTKFLIEIFEARMDDPHERSRFERRRPEQFAGKPTFYPTAEDVIVGKLRWFKQIHRAKDREDTTKVMRSQWRALDWLYVERWCREHGTLDLLNEIKAEVQSLVGE